MHRLILTFALLAPVPLGAQIVAPPVTTPAQRTADTRFGTIANAEYAWRKTLRPSGQEARARDHLPDIGPAAQATARARWTATLAQLDALDPARLSPATRVDYRLYRQQIETLLASQRFRDDEMPVNADTSFWTELAGMARDTLRTEADYRHYIARLTDMPRYIDQQIANMRAGAARGFTAPRVTLIGREVGIAQVVAAGAGDASPYYAPFRTMPAIIPAATQAELRTAAKRAIAQDVVPAHRTLLDFWRRDYFPRTRTTIAAYDLPDGKAYYASKIREYVTRDLTPDQIHAIGLDEVAKIHAQMVEAMRAAGWQGDFASFLAFLRTDPQFYVKTPQALLDRAAWIAKTFDGKASQYFGHLPRSRFAIEPVPPELAPFWTAGRGGPGIYYVNTYDLASRPLYSLPALTLHESAPGHAFQIPLAAELDDLPEYRRDNYISAYGEGWALYCEILGDEMGMYETPYERFGMLSYQMWRAARLVVDTGIHARGWTRAQGQRYFRDNTALSRHEIETEVDRYISWPGQALSYYMGELTFRAGRAKAEQALGAKFDIRAFHDTMLSTGSVTLPLLDERVDRFIADGGKGPYPLK
ncbi:MAG: DUF885 family protein [Sphingomonas bacterium]|nr:DUF885 family protein [Sphingomonas bacterium]